MKFLVAAGSASDRTWLGPRGLVNLNAMSVKKTKNLGGRPALFREPAAMNIKLESKDYEALKTLAHRRGSTPSALVRDWIIQGLARSRRR